MPGSLVGVVACCSDEEPDQCPANLSSELPPHLAPAIGDSAEAFAQFVREETNGGKLLLAATALALVWANVAHDAYTSVWDAQTQLGPAWLELNLTLGDWVADGLLALFFFVAGLELKRELTVGELADRRAATLPFLAAGGGMIVPALLAIAVSGGAAADGGAWAIPVATDIAFALGVLALALLRGRARAHRSG